MINYGGDAHAQPTVAEEFRGEGGQMSMEKRIQIREPDVFAVTGKGDALS